MIPQIFALLLGFAFTFALMPWVMRTAREYHILDYPDSDRRLHPEPVPRLGGVAIFIATALAVAIVMIWDQLDGGTNKPIGTMLPGMITGIGIVFITGIIDDQRGVTPVFKLLAQTVAALAVIAYGFRIDQVTIAGHEVLNLGFFAIPITVLWIVGMTNAFNLIDGVDGLAATCAMIGLAACIVVDYLLHETSGLVMTFAMLGATFAFMRYNKSPAKIFLGDSGSMMLGFFLAVRTVISSTTVDHVTYALIPIFALAYPLTDTFIAIARRWLRGHSFARADGRHVHHQIMSLGLSPARTVELLGLVFIGVALMGISLVFLPPRVTLAFGMGGGILMFAAFFYSVKWLRYSEFMEFGASVTSVLMNARSHVRSKVIAGEIAHKVLRADSLADVIKLLGDAAPEFRLLDITIVPGAPRFHGTDALHISPMSQRPFRVDYPIAWEEQGTVREVILRLWCARPEANQHLGAERIATRLGPALEAWLMTHPGALGVVEQQPRVTPKGFKAE